jgi:hypothetical protein
MHVKVAGTIASTALTLNEFDLLPYLTRVPGLHTVMFTPKAPGRVQATIKGVLCSRAMSVSQEAMSRDPFVQRALDRLEERLR